MYVWDEFRRPLPSTERLSEAGESIVSSRTVSSRGSQGELGSPNRDNMHASAQARGSPYPATTITGQTSVSSSHRSASADVSRPRVHSPSVPGWQGDRERRASMVSDTTSVGSGTDKDKDKEKKNSEFGWSLRVVLQFMQIGGVLLLFSCIFASVAARRVRWEERVFASSKFVSVVGL
jgi:hypothetical protein